MGALITAFVVFLAGVAATGYFVVDRTFGDENAASGERGVSVFLCVPTTTNSACVTKTASELQKQDIKRRLEAMPQVRRVTYESQQQAYERFKKLYAHDEEFMARTRMSDLPDSFRVQVADEEAAKAVKAAIEGAPGVDTVVIDPVAPRA
ncbi:hypothetical protein E1264_06540 [Actinomadura sp. KC216]|nr:hypothetical protein E1264_06540 [Actinomadura sp. KC216]